MNINCTLIIQGLHFGIAYGVLRIFFFKPVIRSIDQESNRQHALHAAIQAHEAALYATQREKESRWIHFQEQVKNKIPYTQPEQGIAKFTVPSLRYPDITKAEVQELKQDVASLLIKQVAHVRT